MSDLDKTMRKALLSTSDVIHDPGAAIAEITRLTERNAELEAECELLAEDNDRAQQVITAHWHNLERERNRADQLQAKLDAVMVMFVYKKGDRYYTGIIGDTDVTDDLQQALKGDV